MKRKSLRGNERKKSLQNLLFNKSSMRIPIIPESPLVMSIGSCSEKLSILETPDTVLKNCGLRKILEVSEEETACNISSSEDFINTPNIFCDNSKSRLTNMSNINSYKKSKSRKTISPSNVIFPFDLNDKEEISRKLNNMQIAVESPRGKIGNGTDNKCSPVFKRSIRNGNHMNNNTIKQKISRAIDCLNSSNQTLSSSPQIKRNGNLFQREKSSECDFSISQLTKSPNFDATMSDMNRNVPDTQPATSLILDGIVAYVDVRSGNDNRSLAIKEFAQSIGAEIANKLTSRVTHLIFKEGSKSTYDRAAQRGIHLVSTLWINACQNEKCRVPESLYPAISANMKDTILSGKYRKTKSMQPLPFEEQEELADARLQKRLKSSKFSTTSNEPSSSTPLRVQRLQHASSRQAIKDFLSPTCRSSTPENYTDSDEEINTPLRERLYQKMFKKTLPFSPLTNEILISETRQNKKRKSPLNSETYINPEKNENSTVKQKSKMPNFNLSRRKSRRLAELKEVRCNMSKVFDMSDLRLSSSPGKVYVDSDINYENTNMEMTNSDSVFIETNVPNAEESVVTDNTERKRSSIANRSHKVPRLEDTAECSNKSIQSSSSLMKKHRLHIVEIDQPTQELIVPNTPNSQEKIPSSIYDSLMEKKFETPTIFLKKQRRANVVRVKGYKPLNKKKTEEAITASTVKEKLCGSITHSDETTLTADSLKEYSQCAALSNQIARPTGNCRPGKLPILPKNRPSIEDFLPPIESEERKRKSCNLKEDVKKPDTICFTSVNSRDIPNLMAIVDKLKHFLIVKSVTASTTHVVCGSERRTLNVIHGISKGCWIVDVSWLFESLELDQWAPEEPFELFNFCPGAKISRIAKTTKSENHNGLLHDVGRISISGTTDPPPSDLKAILKSVGAITTTTTQHADIIIGRKQSDRNPAAVYVDEKWLLDCVQHWKTFPPHKYSIQVKSNHQPL